MQQADQNKAGGVRGNYCFIFKDKEEKGIICNLKKSAKDLHFEIWRIIFVP
ncbi:TPA: hypothetical protein IAC10_01795 [Candidatus Scatousia excrementigallinarum]|uniref:Uncharacterized protein n=1 Tax=Candidatus Scatousia excrementigallinarum TaxID=2840935 RepID=A0A9D1EWR8_9BACT|nr:hypothetical protein [Candidatus Scatousia excrementigallinarum]